MGRQPLRLRRRVEAEPRRVGRDQPQPRQGLQLRLHLLPGRSPGPAARPRGEPRAAGRRARHGAAGGGRRHAVRERRRSTRCRRTGARCATSRSPATASRRRIRSSRRPWRSRPRRAAASRSTTTKIVLITDAAYLAKPAVREALEVMDANNGEIWAKLDAGTEEYFRLIDRPERVAAARPRQHPRRGPAPAGRDPVAVHARERRADSRRGGRGVLRAAERPARRRAAGSRAIQLYTIARKPAEPTRHAALRRGTRQGGGVRQGEGSGGGRDVLRSGVAGLRLTSCGLRQMAVTR